MTLAADRDLVARQYATGFADVFDFGVPAFTTALAALGTVEAAVIDCQLRWLATHPDSLIARKNGPEVAADVQARAADVLSLGGLTTPAGRRPASPWTAICGPTATASTPAPRPTSSRPACSSSCGRIW